jgi:hypothetical protein
VRLSGEALEKCGLLRERLDAVDHDLVALEAELEGVETDRAPERKPRSLPDAAARERSVAARERLVERVAAAGLELVRVSEAVYQTPSGSRVAMPFSKELEPGKWWLGSYDGRFDEVILLCELDSGVEAFHLGPSFLREHLGNMSRDTKGNIKFNVDRIGADYRLRLGNGRSIALRRFDPDRDSQALGGA